MSEQAADPSKPIPNDDPRCRCELEPDPGVGDVVYSLTLGRGAGGETRVAVHLDCPHHGPIARSMQSSLKGFSITR